MQMNEDRLRHPGRNIFVADLVDHYEQTELSEKTGRHSHATRIVYRQYLTRWIRPHWGERERLLRPNNSGGALAETVATR